MTDPFAKAVASFNELASSKARQYNLKVEKPSSAGIRASRGDLLFEFTLDHGELAVAFASRSRPEAYYAAEFVAVLLGGIPSEDLAVHRSQVDTFVASNQEDADPPGPLRDIDWLLGWACQNVETLEAKFCRDPAAGTELDRIVAEYHGDA